jgi:hypothetical protein
VSVIVEALLEGYRVRKVPISAYHLQSNGLVERGHQVIIDTLSKFVKGHRGDWSRHLPLVLFADRVTVRRSTGFSAFRLLYGRDCLIPAEFTVESWGVVDWGSIKSRSDLLHARMLQLEQQSSEHILALKNLQKSRLANKDYFDSHKRLRSPKAPLVVGDLVLLHNTSIQKSWDKKMDDNWLGPYRVRETNEMGYYRLAELDGTQLKESFAGNRLKKFFSREDVSV